MNKNKSNIMLTSAIIAALFLSLLGILIRTFSLFEAFHADTGYYDPAAASPSAFTVLSLAVIPVILLLAVFFRRCFMAPMWTSGIATLFASALLSLTLSVYTVSVVISLPAQSDSYVATLTALAAVFAVIFLAYLCCILFGMEQSREGVQAYLPFALALFALLVAVALYFDKTTQMNQPPKELHMVAFIALACYAICEARYLLGRLKSPLAYVATSLALFFTGAASVPNAVYSIATNRILVLSPVHDFVLLAAFLYLIARLLQMLPYKIPAVHPMTIVLAEREKQAAKEAAITEEATVEEVAPESENFKEGNAPATASQDTEMQEQEGSEEKPTEKKPRKKKNTPSDDSKTAEEA